MSYGRQGKYIFPDKYEINQQVSIEFADFLLADYEMSQFEDGRDDDLCWLLCGTNQKYTTQELYELFKSSKI